MSAESKASGARANRAVSDGTALRSTEVIIIEGPRESGKTACARRIYGREQPRRVRGTLNFISSSDELEEAAIDLEAVKAKKSTVTIYDEVCVHSRSEHWDRFAAAIEALGPDHLVVLVVQDIKDLPPRIRRLAPETPGYKCWNSPRE